MKTVMFRIRIEPALKKKLKEAVTNGKAKNMSELVRAALANFLEEEDQNG